MIIDCFPFFNELELLELRLNELSDIVDVFFLTEATRTFSNKPKSLHYAENKDKFSGFHDRIEHVVMDTYKDIKVSSPWSMDHGQKQYGIDAAMTKYNPTKADTIILTDCDEIPKASVVAEALKHDWHIAGLKMNMYYYWMNCVNVSAKWNRSRLIRPDGRIWHRRTRGRRTDVVFSNAGWHFSYLGDIKEKIGAYAHQELNVPKFTNDDYIAEMKNSGKDLFGREKNKYEFLDDFTYLPEYVLKNMSKFSKFFNFPGEENAR